MTSPVASHDTSGSEECETASGGKTEEFKTPPQEKQETANPPQKVSWHIHVHIPQYHFLLSKILHKHYFQFLSEPL